jgi:dUTP pyrophosphatase
MEKVRIVMNKGDEDLVPVKAHTDDAGFDLHANEEVVVAAHKACIVSTGMRLMLPRGYEAQVRPRSGLALKHSVTVLNSPGTIDCGYTGEVKVILINHGDYDFLVARGDRIAQMVISKLDAVELEMADEVERTLRGEGGFGSTGI